MRKIFKCSSGHFNRELLPNPKDYFMRENLKLKSQREGWVSALCPFHDDRNPSFRVNLTKGCYRCMSCGEHGGDILAFHMKKYSLDFIDACKELGVWE